MLTFLRSLAALALALCASARAETVEIPVSSSFVPVSIALNPPVNATTVTVEVTTHYVEFYAIESTAPFARFVHQSGLRHVSTVVTAPFYVTSQAADIFSERAMDLGAFDGSLDFRGPSSSISQATPQSFVDLAPISVSMPIPASHALGVQFSLARQFTRVSDASVFLIGAVGATVEFTYQ